jgi:hypothetical protein
VRERAIAGAEAGFWVWGAIQPTAAFSDISACAETLRQNLESASKSHYARYHHSDPSAAACTTEEDQAAADFSKSILSAVHELGTLVLDPADTTMQAERQVLEQDAADVVQSLGMHRQERLLLAELDAAVLAHHVFLDAAAVSEVVQPEQVGQVPTTQRLVTRTQQQAASGSADADVKRRQSLLQAHMKVMTQTTRCHVAVVPHTSSELLRYGEVMGVSYTTTEVAFRSLVVEGAALPAVNGKYWMCPSGLYVSASGLQIWEEENYWWLGRKDDISYYTTLVAEGTPTRMTAACHIDCSSTLLGRRMARSSATPSSLDGGSLGVRAERCVETISSSRLRTAYMQQPDSGVYTNQVLALPRSTCSSVFFWCRQAGSWTAGTEDKRFADGSLLVSSANGASHGRTPQRLAPVFVHTGPEHLQALALVEAQNSHSRGADVFVDCHGQWVPGAVASAPFLGSFDVVLAGKLFPHVPVAFIHTPKVRCCVFGVLHAGANLLSHGSGGGKR